MTSPAERLTAKLEQLPISDDASICSLLRTTLLGLLAITGALEERLTRLEATIQPSPTP
ncbi:hypothetical protein [Rhodococcus erythropolis]|uniref:hypothetical protein n=1 Tax=Rhodococcus erythropolis TaxID=1833 RepID=UPI00366BCE1F